MWNRLPIECRNANRYESLDMPKMKKNTPVQVEIIPDMPVSRLKTPYFQWLFENENNYRMTSCPSGMIAEITGRYGSLILFGHEKEVTDTSSFEMKY